MTFGYIVKKYVVDGNSVKTIHKLKAVGANTVFMCC